MAKIKMNDRVEVIDSEYKGKVIDICVENNGVNKNKTYGVFIEGNNFVEYYQKQMLKPIKKSKKENETVYPKEYVLTGLAGGRKITVVGLVDKEKYETVSPSMITDGRYQMDGIFFSAEKRKTLSVGYSICHPEDAEVYSPETGIRIARKRCYERPMTILESPYMGEFRDDLVNAILRTKMDYIVNSIESGEAKFLKA